MLFYSLELIGTLAFAISGALAAIKHRMDVSGVIVLAFVVGNGGGTIRDMMLNTPIFWFNQYSYVAISVFAAIICFISASGRKFHDRIAALNKWLLLFDAVGLGVFAIAGTEKALSVQASSFVAIVMGVITAVGGGVVRDILCSDIPVVFRRELYATLALLGSILYVLTLNHFNSDIAVFGSISVVVMMRILALAYNWHLPLAR